MVGALLFLGTLVYLGFIWPHDLYPYDEGMLLYGAKRILDGQVMYRDFFEIYTPGSWYVMALTYALFGVSMDTARMTMAVLHGLIAALADPAICYRFLSIASPHWFVTALGLLLMFLALRRPATTRGRYLLLGSVVGALALMHQSALAMGSAGALTILIDFAAAPEKRGQWRRLFERFAWYMGGVLVIVVPVLGVLVAAAGWEQIFAQLVLQLFRYDRYHQHVSFVPHVSDLNLDLNAILSNLPTVLVVGLLWYGAYLTIAVGAARALWRWRAGARVIDQRGSLVALSFAGAALLSVLYYPGTSHLGAVAPIWLVPLTEMLERFFSRAESALRLPRLATGLTMLVLLAVAAQLHRVVQYERSKYPVQRSTAFGRVDFAQEDDAVAIETIGSLIKSSGEHEVFVYPAYGSFYLLTDTTNPTRYQFLIPEYNSPAQFDEVRATLELRAVPFIVRTFWWGGDPLQAYISQRYERVQLPAPTHGIPHFVLFRRKDETAATP